MNLFTVINWLLCCNSVLTLIRLLPDNPKKGLNRVSSILPMLIKNVTINADNVHITRDSFAAEHLSIHADEIVNKFFKEKVTLASDEYEIIDYPPLSTSVNKSLNPCQDFYEFVCDGWIKTHQIRDYKLSIEQMDVNRDVITQQLKEIFENRGKTVQLKGSELFFSIYDKCMDTDTRNWLKTVPLFHTLRTIRQENIRLVTDWMILVWPVSLFYAFDVYPDFENATINRLTLFTTSSTFPPECFFDNRFDRQFHSFKHFLTSVLKILVEDDVNGEFFRLEEIERRVSSLIEIDAKLAKIDRAVSESGADNFSSYYNLHSLNQLQTLAPSVNWNKYLLGILPPDLQANLRLDTLMINIANVEVVKELEKMISELNSTVLSDYLDWKIILAQVEYLDDRFQTIKKEFDKEALGILSSEPQWMTCQSVAMNLFPDITNYFYIHLYFPHENQQALKEMIENIRNSFIELLRESAKSIVDFIGFDKKLLDKAALETKYAELSRILPWNYVSLIQAAKRWKCDQIFKKLLELNSRDTFEFPPPESNAFYDPTRNQIGQETKAALNYGGIGVVIGHEITHAFDNEGSQYDECGNLQNWWDNVTATNFRNMQECFIKRYGSIEVPNTNGLTIDGKRTLTENIADNGGIRAAYKAMKLALEKNIEKEKRVRGLEEYGPDQLFFINFAYTWCSRTRPEAVAVLLVNNEHSPDKQRVNTAVTNQDEFLNAFQCYGHISNQAESQCRLW